MNGLEDRMTRISVFALALAFASPALADTCPDLGHQIDDKLRAAQLSEADRAEVLDHRKRGQELHDRAHHAEAEAALNAALAKLG